MTSITKDRNKDKHASLLFVEQQFFANPQNQIMIEVKKKIIKFVLVKPLSTNLCIFENKYFAKSTQINVHENQ